PRSSRGRAGAGAGARPGAPPAGAAPLPGRPPREAGPAGRSRRWVLPGRGRGQWRCRRTRRSPAARPVPPDTPRQSTYLPEPGLDQLDQAAQGFLLVRAVGADGQTRSLPADQGQQAEDRLAVRRTPLVREVDAALEPAGCLDEARRRAGVQTERVGDHHVVPDHGRPVLTAAPPARDIPSRSRSIAAPAP